MREIKWMLLPQIIIILIIYGFLFITRNPVYVIILIGMTGESWRLWKEAKDRKNI